MLFNKLKDGENFESIQIHQSQLENNQHIQYFYSHGGEDIKSIVVLVHGISRNAEEIITRFSNINDKNCLLIAPVFSKKYALDYQRLGRKNKGPRADYLLQAIINELQNKFQFGNIKINLFGFSAGAQFVHRYAFAHPNQIHKVAVASAGWYTLPILSLNYPQGLKVKDEFTNIRFELARILRINFRVYIGEKDCLRDAALNKSKKIDQLQGKNRIERAKNWIKMMHHQYEKYKLINHIDLITLSGVNHDFTDANEESQLSHKVYNWFMENEQ